MTAPFPIYNAKPESLNAHERTIQRSPELGKYRVNLRTAVLKRYPTVATEAQIGEAVSLLTIVTTRVAKELIETGHKPAPVKNTRGQLNLVKSAYELELVRRASAKRFGIGEPVAGAIIVENWNWSIKAIIQEKRGQHQILPEE